MRRDQAAGVAHVIWVSPLPKAVAPAEVLAHEPLRLLERDVARLQMIDHIASLLLEVVSEKQIMREEGGM